MNIKTNQQNKEMIKLFSPQINKPYSLPTSIFNNLQIKSIKFKSFWQSNREIRCLQGFHKYPIFITEHKVLDVKKNFVAVIKQIFNFFGVYSDYTKKKVGQYSICNNIKPILQNFICLQRHNGKPGCYTEIMTTIITFETSIQTVTVISTAIFQICYFGFSL